MPPEVLAQWLKNNSGQALARTKANLGLSLAIRQSAECWATQRVRGLGTSRLARPRRRPAMAGVSRLRCLSSPWPHPARFQRKPNFEVPGRPPDGTLGVEAALVRAGFGHDTRPKFDHFELNSVQFGRVSATVVSRPTSCSVSSARLGVTSTRSGVKSSLVGHQPESA